MEWFLCKPNYRVRILNGVTSTVILSASLLDTDADQNFVNKDFAAPAWKESINPINELQLRTVDCKVMNVEGIVPMFIRIGDLRVLARFVIFENLALDVLIGTSIVN